MAVRAPALVGFTEDDGVYLATGKALADGRGYRHLSLPGEPYQTKYPILFPLLVALIWRCFPAFPANLPVIQLCNAVFAGTAAWIAYRLVRRLWHLPAWLAGSGVIIAASNPTWWNLVQLPMSEHLYGMLALAALALASAQPAAGDSRAPPTPRWPVAVLAGLLASAAYLTRSIGVSVIIAVIGSYALNRHWRAATCAGLAAGVPAALWLIWRASAVAANRAIPQASAFAYDLDYGAWLPASVPALTWVLYHNLARIALGFFVIMAVPPEDWLIDQILGGIGARLLVYACMFLMAGLCLVGLVWAWSRTRAGLHLYLAAYFALVWIWPFPPDRFLVPLLPLLVPALLAAARRVLVLALPADRGYRTAAEQADTAPGRQTSLGVGGAIAAAAVLTLLAWNVRGGFAVLSSIPARVRLEQRAGLVSYVREHTPPEAVLASTSAAYLHLVTGRKAVPLLPADNPVAILYPPDACFLHCGRIVTPRGVRACRRLLENRLVEYYRQAGVSHVIVTEGGGAIGLVREFVRLRPSSFPRLSQVGLYEIYAFRPGS
jgi:hypothetical protein